MADLNELSEKPSGIKAEIKEELLKLETSKSVFEYKKAIFDSKAGKVGSLMREMGKIPNEMKAEYGKLPGEVNPSVLAAAGILPEDVITCRPADLLEPELEKYRKEYADIAKSDEDILSLALFPQVAPKFLAYRDSDKTEAAPAKAQEAAAKAAPADPNAVRELYVEFKGL